MGVDQTQCHEPGLALFIQVFALAAHPGLGRGCDKRIRIVTEQRVADSCEVKINNTLYGLGVTGPPGVFFLEAGVLACTGSGLSGMAPDPIASVANPAVWRKLRRNIGVTVLV